MMEAKLRQMANSSSFIERPALPCKPTAPPRGTPQGTRSQRALNHGTRSISDKIEGTKGSVARDAPPSLQDTESSDIMRIPSSSKQRSIPGVKIVKGGSNKGTSEVTPSA